MKIVLLIIISLLIMGCSQNKKNIVGVESEGEYYALDHAAKEAVSENDGEQRLVCRRTSKTGSHFKVKRCTTKKQLAAERKAALELRENNSVIQSRTIIDSKSGN